MFDFGNANEGQRKAIEAAEGPVLITAGPGTGKTYTLVQRTIYLITECGVKPENILIATFTEKAAKELITRITNELTSRNITTNINDMYIGTFHAICVRILNEHLEFTRLRQNYRILDEFDQPYTVFQNIDRFLSNPHIKVSFLRRPSFNSAAVICSYVNAFSEELLSPDTLIADEDTSISSLGWILKEYRAMLMDNNLLDFSSIQFETYQLLQNNKEILDQLHSKITHIMVDEYQDTNFIQEQLIFLLAGEKKNICVVGDDDQGIYRFRGATIRNILEFPQKFANGECRVIPLVINYRSNSDIIDFYNKWMSTTDGANFKFSWNNYRYSKEIQPHEKTTFHNPAVLKLSSVDDSGAWREKILSFINKLMESGKLTDYNQIAFLFNSVKNPKVAALARFLEDNNINVHSPRSSMFFKRDEIKLAIGCLLLVFPNYVQKLENDEYDSRDSQYLVYYKNCITIAKSYLVQPKNKKLSDWITNKGKIHSQLKDNTELSYCDLLYQLFEFQPFSTTLSTEVGVGAFNNRPSRNLAKLTQIIRKFECNYGVATLNDTGCNEEASIDQNTEKLFNSYLSILTSRGINEHEDDSEYAPSGCVSFLTIHQAKGLEFPIVIIDSLDNVPRENTDPILVKIEQKYYKRPKFEPQENIKYFDFWRLYYAAFSRAQNLLILTCNEDGRTPSKYFKNSYADLQSVDSPDLDIDEFNFTPIKDVNIKPTYPLTSHIAIYETCPLQYKLYKELGFVPIRANNTLLGKLVHSTIEDIHRALLMDEKQSINRENVLSWFDSNYTALTKTYAAQLSDEQRNTALKQIFLYAAKQQDIDWSQLQQSGVKVSLVKPDYIILGKIDLLQGEDDNVEIVDFKYEQKPDMEKMKERIEQHIRQLHIYAHLVEKNTGKKVSKMHIYYTEEKDEAPIVTYPYTKDSEESTLALLDDTVHKIMKKDFQKCTDNLDVCNECDFQFYCKGRYHLE